MSLDISCTPDESVHYLVVAGEVDVTTVNRFREQMAECIDATASAIVLDLTGVTFCDAQGVSALVRAHKAIETRMLLSETQSLWRVISLCKLDQKFNIDLV